MSRYVLALPGVLACRLACSLGFSDQDVKKAGANVRQMIRCQGTSSRRSYTASGLPPAEGCADVPTVKTRCCGSCAPPVTNRPRIHFRVD
jgi:hypothetical protein